MVSFLTPEVKKVALSVMEGLDCPRSLTVSLLIQSEQWEDLVKLSTDPLHHLESDAYFRSAAADSFLRKLEETIPGVDIEEATFQKWLEAERQCFKTNKRLSDLIYGSFVEGSRESRLAEFLGDVKRWMRWLLGPVPTVVDGVFGPGATISDTSDRVTLGHKMSSTPTYTTSALYYLVPWTGTAWAKACAAREDKVRSVPGNKYFSVPKTAIIGRPCAKEASINAYYQRGYGRVMAQRLRRRGIDLESAKDVHMQVACTASTDESYCTLDLTSASDTICAVLVETCTPDDWFEALDSLRAKYTEVNGTNYRLEKFSSMGNGFTFELETSLFLSICLASHPELTPGVDLYVFGDDIIVPTYCADDVIWALRFCGFSLNDKKSFVKGPFRESCGGDYFNGDDVRPYFLKESPNEPQQYMAFANGIRLLYDRVCRLSSSGNSRLLRAWHKATDLVALPARNCRGPRELGDIVLHDSESNWRVHWRNSIRYFRTYRPHRSKIVKWSRFGGTVQIACALYGCSLKVPFGKGNQKRYDDEGFIPRDGVISYSLGWAAWS